MNQTIRTAILVTILAGVIGYAGYVFYDPHPCAEPLAYSVGRVDDEFSIGTSTFAQVVEDAASVWEKEAGQKLFVRKAGAGVTVNLIFDERQRRTNASERIKRTLDDLIGSHKETIARYKDLKAELEQAQAAYQQLKQRYETELAAYNERVERWNEQGGVPPRKRGELEARKQELEAMQDRLEERRVTANDLTAQVNQLVREDRSILSEYRSKADTYTQRYGGRREFEQGHTAGDTINIYQYNRLNDLRLVLVHEWGHVLGIEHLDDPQAVMHYLMEKQQLDPIRLTDADKKALERVCSGAGYFRFF